MMTQRSYTLLALLFLLLFSVPTPLSAQDRDPALSSSAFGPDIYPLGINPLTGLPVADPTLLSRRPLLIKISNYPPLVRQYQRGLSEADVVWESLLSGGVTRFSAVFLSEDLPRVGPIRSGRLLDFELTRIYRALFTYSGMAQGALDVLWNDSLMMERVVGGGGPCPPLCRYPQEGLALEHTLFGDTLGLRELAVERERDVTPERVYGMAFAEAAPSGGTPLDTVTVRYAESVVGWEYDAGSNRWLRWQDGEPHVDANGRRISATNVIILEEEHTIQPFVRAEYWGPGDFAFSVNFIGSGRAYFLRDGHYQAGEWRRAERSEPLTYFDLDGSPILLRPGSTFINLVPLWIDGYELVFKTPNPPQTTVTGTTGAAMRFGPSVLYATPDVAYPHDTFNVYGRSWNGHWLQVQRGDESAVWLPVDRLDIGELDVMALPLARPSSERGG